MSAKQFASSGTDHAMVARLAVPCEMVPQPTSKSSQGAPPAAQDVGLPWPM